MGMRTLNRASSVSGGEGHFFNPPETLSDHVNG